MEISGKGRSEVILPKQGGNSVHEGVSWNQFFSLSPTFMLQTQFFSVSWDFGFARIKNESGTSGTGPMEWV